MNGDATQKIVLEDPRSSTPGLGFLLWMKSVYGDKARDAWTKLKPRILTVTPGWSEAYGLFTKGEAPMVLSYTTSPAYHMIEEKTDRYQAASFSEGHYLQIEVAGLIADSPEAELAQKFLAFMVSPGFQDAIPETNWMFPVTKTTEPLPAAFDTLGEAGQDAVLLARRGGAEPAELDRRMARRHEPVAAVDDWLLLLVIPAKAGTQSSA